MKISPLNYGACTDISRKNLNTQNNNLKSSSKNLNFTSIFADANGSNQNLYAYYTVSLPDMFKIKSSSTRIFRELPSQLAMAKILKPDEKSEIKVLGCSDGSEAWAYAIVMKEQMGQKAQENVKIKGVDIAPWIIETAQTGKIVCSDIEKKYANGSGGKTGADSPLRGSGWDKYLIKSDCPDSFDGTLEKYPFMKYMVYDPVVQKTIGNGLEWYEVNKEGLPEVSFEAGDMFKHLKGEEDKDNIVYVVANSAGYLVEKSPDEYIKLFEKIKEENKNNGKNIYVVIGDVENTILNPAMARSINIKPAMQNKIRNSIQNLGYSKIDEIKLRKMGVSNYKDASSKIYTLKSN